jgi:hypothetical protein
MFMSSENDAIVILVLFDAVNVLRNIWQPVCDMATFTLPSQTVHEMQQ